MAATTSRASALVLHQFHASHYNEKARWALDYRGAAHRRVSYLPGLHTGAIKRLSGNTTTPVLQDGEKVITGSAAIIDHLERTPSERSLYPQNAQQRSSALAWQQQWDSQLGPATRALFFAAALSDLDFVAAIFGKDSGALKLRLYRGMLTFARGVIAKANGADDPAKVAAARAIVQRSLDDLSVRINADDQLIHNGFTVADLTCAALLLPIVETTHPALAPGVATPPGVAQLRAEFAEHPAIAWTQRQYERHRPQKSSAIQ